MKGQNKYAQLVETQSPEPQERSRNIEPDDDRIDGGGESFVIEEKEKSVPGEGREQSQQVSYTNEPRELESTEQSEFGRRRESFENVIEDREPQVELRRIVTRSNSSSTSSISHPATNLPANQLTQLNECRLPQALSRKFSRSSSQVSTTVLSNPPSSVTTTDYSRRSSSIAGSVSYNPALLNSAQFDQHAAAISINDNDSSQTISKSMLAFDKSHRMDRFEIVWNNLSFNYAPKWFNRPRKKPVYVLNDISGRIKSNQLVAVIGPSGCGKTTLLQFLAGNNPEHKDKMRVVGLEEPKVAFIGQDDCLLPGLTPRETLIYASRLQNNDPSFNHEQHVLPILNQLGLSECADRSVTKLSGGQAKRVTIAQELLYPTNLLILDEVTSGLDASTSYSIIKLLERLVSDSSYPMSIVISIHQPSAKLFAVFNQVYVMANGCCLYEGSCEADMINAYLSRFSLKCPQYTNLADYLIELATNNDLVMDVTIREQMIQYQRKQSELQDSAAYSINVTTGGEITGESEESSPFVGAREAGDRANEIYNKNNNSRPGESEESLRMPMLMSGSLYDSISRAREKKLRPFCSHFVVHLERSFLRIRRSYILTWLQLITYIFLGVQLATFYGQNIGTLSGCPRLPSSLISLVLMDGASDEDMSEEMRRIQENMNFLLVAVMTATFAALEITVITFPLEAKTVKREWRNGWYRVSSYFMGRTVADMPFQLTFVIIFCVIVYTMTGQIGLTTWRFAVFVAIIVMIALIAQAVGFTFGAMFMDNLPAAVFTAPLCIFPALLFSGFFSRVSQIPSFYKPMTYVSHFRYAFDSLLVTLYGYNRCECDQETLTSYHANIHNQTSTMKETFKYLFGSSECGPTSATADPKENSIEDVVTTASAEANAILLSSTTSTPTTMASVVTTRFKSIEDALADSVFEHMSSNSTSSSHSTAEDFGSGAMDHLAGKFSTRITQMFNKQSNYGHSVPEQCDRFNSYLMTEFDLRNEDLFWGLAALFTAVVLTRLVCNLILNFTIATRAR